MKKPLFALLGIAALVTGSYFGGNQLAATEAEHRLNQLVTRVDYKSKGQNRFQYGDIKASRFGTAVKISDLQFDDSNENLQVRITSTSVDGLTLDSQLPENIKLSNVTLNFQEQGEPRSAVINNILIEGLPQNSDSPFPERLALTLNGLSVPVLDPHSIPKTGNQLLDKLAATKPGELKKIDLNARMELQYNALEKQLVTDMYYDVESLYSNHIFTRLHGMQIHDDALKTLQASFKSKEEPGLHDLLIDAQNIALGKTSMEFINKGVAKLAWEAAATKSGSSKEKLKEKALAQLDELGMALGTDIPILNNAVKQIQQFIIKPERLSLSIAPATPIVLEKTIGTAMMNPQALINSLNLEVHAN